ncbi:MAG TPA: iron-containing alcohol dehydrogenase [Thermoplasmata archaeon]|nr:iron-containing alcohol dehydrogenase [Thermoplasmata archaeon]
MWFFRAPTIVFGEESLSYLSSLEIRKAVIVTDRYLAKTELPDKVRAALPSGAESLVVADIGEEPTLGQMTQHLEEIRRFQPEWLLGVGGGSSIDTAKILFFLYERPDLTVYDATPLVPLGLRKKCRLIAVPTTSGTGSECTWAAVLSEEPERRKHELASPEIIPDYAILDPEMVLSLPPEATRNTAVDAIVHAIEGYTSTWKNPYSDAFSEKALELILGSLPGVLAHPSDRKLRGDVHIGASMAGLSFSNSQIGLAHALGHALGARFKIPHGKTVGIFLPLVIDFNRSACEERYARLNAIFPAPYRGAHLADSVRRFFQGIGQAYLVKDVGVERKEYFSALEELVSGASESTGLVTNPRDSGTPELRELFTEAFGSEG